MACDGHPANVHEHCPEHSSSKFPAMKELLKHCFDFSVSTEHHSSLCGSGSFVLVHVDADIVCLDGS